MIPATYNPVYVEQHGLDWWRYAIIAIAAFAIYDVLLWAKDTLADVARSRWAAWQESHAGEAVEDASDDRPECEVDASCEPGDHTGSWPCEVPASWTPPDHPTPDEAARQVPLQVAYKSRSET